MCGVIILIGLLIAIGAILFYAGATVIALSAFLIGGVVMLCFIPKQYPKSRKVIWVLVALVLIIAPIFVAASITPDKSQTEESQPQEVVDPWRDTFIEHGFTEKEVDGYVEILATVGITDFGELELHDNGIMNVAKFNEVFGKSNLGLHVTFENHEIIYICFAGFPDYAVEHYINWRGKWDYKYVPQKGRVDLFSDTEGGYLAKVDWENQQILDMEGNLITTID